VLYKCVCVTTNQPDTNSNPNPNHNYATRQHAIVSIRLSRRSYVSREIHTKRCCCAVFFHLPLSFSHFRLRAFPVSCATVMERPAFPSRICAVTRGFQTRLETFLFYGSYQPRHDHMTHVLLLPFITTVWTHVVYAIINITEATLKCL